MTPLAAIAARLRTRMGLDPETLGSAALEDAVRQRRRARAIADPASYLALLDRDPAEWQALVEAVVVPETWFFRDREPFALVARWAAKEWPTRNAGPPLAVLSLPCASGEEAWSIAIALAAAGVPPAGMRIEAVDVSERALAVARTGRYPRRALRGGPPRPEWAQYLTEQEDGTIEVAAALRSAVQFTAANLVEAAATFAGRQFDCVFSRNLLIYCDAATRTAALATFAALVRPGGLLVLGHAETLPRGSTAFVRERPAGAFAWRRVTGNARPTVSGPAPSRAAGARPPATSPPRRHRRELPATHHTEAAAHLGVIAEARGLADAGHLDDAAALVEAELKGRPADADAHALLGIIRVAQGRDDAAAECLRRALYLDPRHEDALAHLAALLDARGDHAAAARLRARSPDPLPRSVRSVTSS